ncbi:Trypsin CFT-1 [Eumeta japonica]|uniref:Trypsin CFT-1 n=1 Tax=Eumeta variegata TaxID=151549 RepID=A0A4C1WFF1_EUMVA|nr:Trypsin CFT-1 [Eumeta japonica]
MPTLAQIPMTATGEGYLIKVLLAQKLGVRRSLRPRTPSGREYEFDLRGHVSSSWRVRVGSNLANDGGNVYVLRAIVLHQQYDALTADNDIAVLRTENLISYESDRIAPASISGAGYNVADNQPVWAVGWGAVSSGGPSSEQLQHVHLRIVDLSLCQLRYSELGMRVTDNMLCSGWLEGGGRGICDQDAGGPLVHNRVVVGVLSWSQLCGLARYPSVSTRISNYIAWIRSVATG